MEISVHALKARSDMIRTKRTVNVKTFTEYADHVFVSHIRKLLEDSKRVWDIYLPRSIKGSTL